MARKLITATWDDCPHLSEQAKADMFAALPPHQRDARSKGIPALGAGAIYPVPESEITVKPFKVPEFYQYAAGMDVGWNWTACVWFARDPNTGVTYVVDCYKAGQREPAVHAQAIKARGAWVPIAIDPASRGRSQGDGSQLYETYFDLGLDLVKANNTVEDGIYRVWTGLSSGNLKLFDTCVSLLAEYRIYRRDENGRIIKKDDHLMDSLRYGYVTGVNHAVSKQMGSDEFAQHRRRSTGNAVTGY